MCTLGGLPIAFALTGAKADERETLLDIFATEPELVSSRPGQTLIGDKNYFGREFEAQLANMHIELLRPARKGEAERAGSQLFKPLRQVIESINETFKGQLDLERHHGRTPGGVIVRVLQRLLALTAAIWHNQHTGQPIMRSLTPMTTNGLESIVYRKLPRVIGENTSRSTSKSQISELLIISKAANRTGCLVFVFYRKMS